MILIKPKFWDQKISLISIFLFPLSLIFLLFVNLKRKFTKIKSFKIPIICIGNIYIGGTGKTPTSIFFAKELSKLGKKPSILRKFYKSHIDEYKLIKKNYKNLILKNNRTNALKVLEKSKFDTIILDDGLQDYRIKKNLNIVCFSSNQLIGNGFLLPAGPLRESLIALKDAHIVIINGDKVKAFEKKILNINPKLEIFYSFYKPINIKKFKNKKLLAIAGIGNPQNFFQLIEKNNLNIEKKLIFPDHYKFSKTEIQNILKEAREKKLQIIMTEKDYYKIQDYKIDKIEYLKVSLKIKSQKKLLARVRKLYDKNI
tara:strand:- start:529 stop:1470 length:942 start_codon:yes stop_codon:yes gene_type:complete